MRKLLFFLLLSSRFQSTAYSFNLFSYPTFIKRRNNMRKRMKPIFKSLLACGLIGCFALTLNAQSTYSPEDLQRITLNNNMDNGVQPPQADLSQFKSEVCSGTVTFEDPVICNIIPPIGDMIDIAVGFVAGTCQFDEEVQLGGDTLLVAGLTVYMLDADGNRDYLGTVLESETLETTACAIMPLMVPTNLTCDPVVTTFEAVTSVFNVLASTGVITSAMDDIDCAIDTFTVTVNPTLILDIIEDTSDGCGSATVQLLAEDGSVCSEPLTATCTANGDISIPLGETYGCIDESQTVICSSCPEPEVNEPTGVCNCANGIDLDGDGNVDLHPVTYIVTDPLGGAGQGWALTSVSGFQNSTGDVIMVPPPPTSAMPLIDNGDGTYTFTAFVPADGTTTYTATFTADDDDELTVSGGPCAVCEPEPEVPTVGEWGLIILGLLMMIAAIVGIRQRITETQIG